MSTVMAPKVKAVEPAVNGGEHNSLLEAARKVLYASIGAVALAQGEIEDFVNKLVDRGQIAEKDGRKLLQELMERRNKSTKQTELELDKRIEELLARMNVPTKADLEALSTKISALTRKVEELKKG